MSFIVTLPLALLVNVYANQVSVTTQPVEVVEVKVKFVPSLANLALPQGDWPSSLDLPKTFFSGNLGTTHEVSDHCKIFDAKSTPASSSRYLRCTFPLVILDLSKDLPKFSAITAFAAYKHSNDYGPGGDLFFKWSFYPLSTKGYDNNLRLKAEFFDRREITNPTRDDEVAAVNKQLVVSYQKWRTKYLEAFSEGTLIQNATNEFSFEVRP